MPPPSSLCLSRDSARGAPAPTHSLVSRQGRRVSRTPSWSGTPRELHSYTWGRGAAQSSRPHRPQGWQRPGHQLPPSFKSPTPTPGAAWKLGAGGCGPRPSPALCVPNPAVPGPRASGSRSLVPARRPPRRGAGRAPARTLWHSQWRRGCSCKLGPVRAAGAQAGPGPEALPSERTTRR